MRQKIYVLMFAFMMSALSVNAQIINKDQTSTNFGKVVWLGITLNKAVELSETGYVYLYNVSTDKFLNAGGSYGVQGVVSSIGMRVKIKYGSNGTHSGYTIEGRVANAAQGSFLSPNGGGDNIYIDRAGKYTTGDQYSRPYWTFTNSTGSITLNGTQYTTNTFRITNNDRNNSRLGLSGNNTVFGNTGSDWRIIAEKDYLDAMDNVTWGEVDLGAFVQDADFGRDSKDARYWIWSVEDPITTPSTIKTRKDSEKQDITLDTYSTITSGNTTRLYDNYTESYVGNTFNPTHWHQRNQDVMCNGVNLLNGISRSKIGSNVAGTGNDVDHDGFRNSYAQYYAAEIYNEKISLTQTVSMSNVKNLNSGLYKLSIQALYDDGKTGAAAGTTNGDGTLDGAVAYVIAIVQDVDEDGNPTGEPHVQRLPVICRNSIALGSTITRQSGVSAGYAFDNNPNAYVTNFFIELKQTSRLTIGIETTKAEGWTVFGNVHLYCNGKQVVFIDEDWSDQESLTYEQDGATITMPATGTDDPYKLIGFYNNNYSYPIYVNYQRTMTKDKWNTICLPIPVNGSQVIQAFGEGCKLSKLKIVDDNIMRFHSVNLDVEGIEAGVPYIIKPTREPDVPVGESETQTVGNGGENHTVTVEGPTYYIPGVDNSKYEKDSQGNPKLPTLKPYQSDESTYGQITFEGTFYKRPVTTSFMQNNDVWMITQGDMWHLTGKQEKTLWATYCYLHAPKETSAGAKSMRIMVDDEEVMTTAIEGLMIDYGPTINDNKVYTLNGQRVGGVDSLNSLPKGVYIVNGKKYVVK